MKTIFALILLSACPFLLRGENAALPAAITVEETVGADVPQENPAEADADAYREEIRRIVTEIQKESRVIGLADKNNSKAAAAAYRAAIEKLAPLYEELADLEAPEAFAAQQEIIRTGADASWELMLLSAEILEAITAPQLQNAAETLKKTETLKARTDELREKASAMNRAIKVVLEK